MIPLTLISFAARFVGERFAKPFAALAMVLAAMALLFLLVQCIRSDAVDDDRAASSGRVATKQVTAERRGAAAADALTKAEDAKQQEMTDAAEEARRDDRSPLDAVFDSMR